MQPIPLVFISVNAYNLPLHTHPFSVLYADCISPYSLIECPKNPCKLKMLGIINLSHKFHLGHHSCSITILRKIILKIHSFKIKKKKCLTHAQNAILSNNGTVGSGMKSVSQLPGKQKWLCPLTTFLVKVDMCTD